MLLYLSELYQGSLDVVVGDDAEAGHVEYRSGCLYVCNWGESLHTGSEAQEKVLSWSRLYVRLVMAGSGTGAGTCDPDCKQAGHTSLFCHSSTFLTLPAGTRQR